VQAHNTQPSSGERIKEEKIDQGTPGRNLKREYHESFLTPGFSENF
jgi:hypothetical protein